VWYGRRAERPFRRRGIAVIDRPDDADGVSQAGEDLLEEIGDRRFAVGSGDADEPQRSRGGAVPGLRHFRIRLLAVVDGNNPGFADRCRGGIKTPCLDKNRGTAATDRIIDIDMTVEQSAGDGDKEAAGENLA